MNEERCTHQDHEKLKKNTKLKCCPRCGWELGPVKRCPDCGAVAFHMPSCPKAAEVRVK